MDVWTRSLDACHDELAAYLLTAGEAAVHDLPTRCPPWTVRDVTRHLAATFERFNRMLARSRAGDLSKPFEMEDLGEENLRAVREFDGEPEARLREEATAFLAAAGDPDEMIAHQFGPIPMSLQVIFGLADLTIHHDDVAVASGARYRPPEATVGLLVDVWSQRFGGGPEGDDAWEWILRASGR